MLASSLNMSLELPKFEKILGAQKCLFSRVFFHLRPTPETCRGDIYLFDMGWTITSALIEFLSRVHLWIVCPTVTDLTYHWYDIYMIYNIYDIRYIRCTIYTIYDIYDIRYKRYTIYTIYDINDIQYTIYDIRYAYSADAQ